MFETYINIIVALIYIFVGFPIAFALNNKFNPANDKGFKYGYFLSVATIFNNIIYIIIIYYSFFINKSYYYRTTTKDVLIYIFFILLITAFHVFIAVLNGKKYKIGAILVSIFTGQFVICGFYFYNRWSELKKLPKIQSMKINNNLNINNLNYKNILVYHSLGEYINLFHENRLTDIKIIVTLSENDYEKLGVKYLGDIKRLKSIFSEKELAKNEKNYMDIENKENNNTVFVEEKKEDNVIKDNSANNILITLERGYNPIYAAVPFPVFIDEEEAFTIENNANNVYPVKNGSHIIYIRLDHCTKSEIINFNSDIKLKLTVLGVGSIKLEEK